MRDVVSGALLFALLLAICLLCTVYSRSAFAYLWAATAVSATAAGRVALSGNAERALQHAERRAWMHWVSLLVFVLTTRGRLFDNVACVGDASAPSAHTFAWTLFVCALSLASVASTLVLRRPRRGAAAVTAAVWDECRIECEAWRCASLGLGTTLVRLPLCAARVALLLVHGTALLLERWRHFALGGVGAVPSAQWLTVCAIFVGIDAFGTRAVFSGEWHWRDVTRLLTRNRRVAAALAASCNVCFAALCALGLYVGATAPFCEFSDDGSR